MAERSGIAAAILHQVRTRPKSIALIHGDHQLTYAQLYNRATKIRRELVPGPVAVLAEKSFHTIAVIFACLLTGHPILLLSNDLPAEVRNGLTDRLISNTTATGTAFLLTTSGSTGAPKVVPLTNTAVDRFIAWAADTFGLRPDRRVLNIAPLNFDLCLLDIWASLAHGVTVVMVEHERATRGRYLVDLIDKHRVSVVQSVPMFFALLLDAVPLGGLPSVDQVIVTGETIPDRVAARLPEAFPGARLHNVYGCTETNDSFAGPVLLGNPRQLGEPLPGVSALVLDNGMVLRGKGTGELCVRTPFQFDDYLGDHGRFVTVRRKRYFRTGDLVERDGRGMLYLCGRSDFQVKVRGITVNTAEIERVLLTHSGVIEAAVRAIPDPMTGKRLVAAIHTDPDSHVGSLELRTHCARSLPRGAIPSEIRLVASPLPKTPTGKIDRNTAVRAELPTMERRMS